MCYCQAGRLWYVLLPGKAVQLALAHHTQTFVSRVIMKFGLPNMVSLVPSVVLPHWLASVLFGHVEGDAVTPHQALDGIQCEVQPETA